MYRLGLCRDEPTQWPASGPASLADAFPYVNGGLFADALDVPKFDRGAYRYLQDACQLDWQEINPDIFGP